MQPTMRRLVAALASLAIVALTLAAPAQADGHVRIHLIHGIPGVDVDVEVAGDNVFEGFSFGDTQDLTAFAGATLEGLKVKVAGTDTVAIDVGDLALPADGNFTAIAHLDANGTPTVGVFQNNDSATGAGQGRLTVRHTAAAPAVDVWANGDVAFANVPNGAGGDVDLPVSTVSAEVVPAGATEPVVIGPADLPITDGTNLIVYAVGSLDDGSLTVLTESISGLASAPAVVHTGNSPIESGGGGISLMAIGLAAMVMVVAVSAPTAARVRR